MEETVEAMVKNYQENLKPTDYHKVMIQGLTDMSEIFIPPLTAIHKLMKSGRFQGKKLLEIGSGATVHNVASPSAYFTEIVQSDFVEANCEELRKWHGGESELDWTPFLETVAKIEGSADPSTACREIENRIRKSVKAVAHCDLLSDDVVPREFAVQYDVILMANTVEAAARDFESYVAILIRVNRLLRPGGGLVMCGFINGERWNTGGGEFHCLKVSQEEINNALNLAGFTETEWTLIPKEKHCPLYDYESYYFVAAAKV